MTVQDALLDLLGRHADAIAGHFKSGAKVTIIIRNPGFDGPEKDADAVVTDDDLDEVVKAAQRAAERDKAAGGGDA